MREYERTKPLPDWLKVFADEHLKEANPFEKIRNLFQQDNQSVEAKVQELTERVGLDQIEKTASNQTKERAENINKLIILADQLEKDGDYQAAQLIDNQIKELAAMDDINPSYSDDKDNKTSKLKELVDGICEVRHGFIDMPAILKLLRDKHPEDIDERAGELTKYIEEKLKETRPPEEDDDLAGLALVVVEPDEANKEVFDKPARSV